MKLQEYSADEPSPKHRIVFDAVSLIIDRITCKCSAELGRQDNKFSLHLGRDNKVSAEIRASTAHLGWGLAAIGAVLVRRS